MPTVFSGDHPHKIEPRGRVSIPVDFRRVLKDANIETLFLVPRMQGMPCHALLTPNAFDAYVESFHRRDLSASEQRAVSHHLIGRSRMLAIDDLGRIVIPAPFREQLSIDERCVFVGVGPFFELWDPDTLEAHWAAEAAVAEAVISDNRITDLPL